MYGQYGMCGVFSGCEESSHSETSSFPGALPVSKKKGISLLGKRQRSSQPTRILPFLSLFKDMTEGEESVKPLPNDSSDDEETGMINSSQYSNESKMENSENRLCVNMELSGNSENGIDREKCELLTETSSEHEQSEHVKLCFTHATDIGVTIPTSTKSSEMYAAIPYQSTEKSVQKKVSDTKEFLSKINLQQQRVHNTSDAGTDSITKLHHIANLNKKFNKMETSPEEPYYHSMSDSLISYANQENERSEMKTPVNNIIKQDKGSVLKDIINHKDILNSKVKSLDIRTSDSIQKRGINLKSRFVDLKENIRLSDVTPAKDVYKTSDPFLHKFPVNLNRERKTPVGKFIMPDKQHQNTDRLVEFSGQKENTPVPSSLTSIKIGSKKDYAYCDKSSLSKSNGLHLRAERETPPKKTITLEKQHSDHNNIFDRHISVCDQNDKENAHLSDNHILAKKEVLMDELNIGKLPVFNSGVLQFTKENYFETPAKKVITNVKEPNSNILNSQALLHTQNEKEIGSLMTVKREFRADGVHSHIDSITDPNVVLLGKDNEFKTPARKDDIEEIHSDQNLGDRDILFKNENMKENSPFDNLITVRRKDYMQLNKEDFNMLARRDVMAEKDDDVKLIQRNVPFCNNTKENKILVINSDEFDLNKNWPTVDRDTSSNIKHLSKNTPSDNMPIEKRIQGEESTGQKNNTNNSISRTGSISIKESLSDILKDLSEVSIEKSNTVKQSVETPQTVKVEQLIEAKSDFELVYKPHTMQDINRPTIPNQIKKEDKCLSVNGKIYLVQWILGRGGSSEVFQVLNANTSQQLAVKCVDLSVADPSIAQSYLNEIALLKRLQGSESVIKMIDYEYVENKQLLYVVMEKGETDLSKLIKDISKTNPIPLSSIVHYWCEMLRAVKSIHANGVIHSDLKPANFLLVSGRLKLIDFGIASSVQSDMTSVMKDSPAGTFNYMSPEAIQETCSTNGNKKQIKISYKTDIWSLGCILYNLLCGKTPFQHIAQVWAKLAAITNPDHHINYTAAREDCPPVLLKAVQLCLTYDPKKRPTAAELLDLPYFNYNKV